MRHRPLMPRLLMPGPAAAPPAAARQVMRRLLAWPGRHGSRVLVLAVAACGAAAALSGCAAGVTAGAAPALAVTSAYVPLPAASVPGTTVAFLDIRNNGGPDRLVAARTSVGGKVVFAAPAGVDATATKTLQAISIPAGSTVRLLPNDAHLLITGAGHMRGGKNITLFLTFARAGTMSVAARVIDPQSGGGYFTN